MSRFAVVVLAEAAPGREPELVEWYDDHLRRMASVPVVASARRYEPDRSRSAPDAPSHLAIYELHGDDLAGALAELGAARAAMPSTDALAGTPAVWILRSSEGDAAPDRSDR